jgi:hypothetical protein
VTLLTAGAEWDGGVQQLPGRSPVDGLIDLAGCPRVHVVALLHVHDAQRHDARVKDAVRRHCPVQTSVDRFEDA